jgi:3-hydroxyisobutyrate dehydrogenase-like beta-hydroxyacid dehydrogenase
MSDVTVVGLGPMGTALAKTLLSAAHEVTVWNRSSEKADSLVADGATFRASISEAIEASPIVLVCVNNYATSDSLLTTKDTLASLQGRILVQLSTGTSTQAINSATVFEANGVGYLDGVMLGSPVSIGTPEMQILIAGNETSWQACEAILGCLAEKLQYTGSKIDSAAILDLAWLSQRLGLFMGVFQGLLLCEAAGIGAGVFGQTVAADSRIVKLANTVHNNDYENPVNTVNVWYEAMRHIKTQADACGINTEVLDFIASKFEQTIAAGHGEEDLAAVIKVLQAGR